jgi:hypothetical protein
MGLWILLLALPAGLLLGAAAARGSAGSRRQSERDHTPRDASSADHAQTVGFACARCGVRIVVATEAVKCPTCGKPVHKPCMPHAHGADQTPYRG